jgi:cell division protein FtsL
MFIDYRKRGSCMQNIIITNRDRLRRVRKKHKKIIFVLIALAIVQMFIVVFMDSWTFQKTIDITKMQKDISMNQKYIEAYEAEITEMVRLTPENLELINKKGYVYTNDTLPIVKGVKRSTSKK